MVKRLCGLAVFVSPCGSPGIWPVLRTKAAIFSVFYCSLWLLEDWVTLIIQKPYSKLFFYISLCFISLSSNERMSSCPCSIPPVLSIICSFLFWINVLLYSCHTFRSFLPSHTSLFPFTACCILYIFLHLSLYLRLFPTSSPYSVPLFPLRCTHLCDRLLLTHSTSASPQMRAKGRVWCRA